MPHSVFISYSRRESPFVDVFLDALESEGIDVWLDYRSLVPGKPWLDQILAGIRQADVFLLIVSKASITSKNVELEYTQALEQKKRIILIIFEAVSLPPALQTCEWIDFRTSFKKRTNELIVQLAEPIQQSSPPQSGFKIPFIVWISFLVSLLVIVISSPGWWTFFLPIVLLPLPYRILKRDFNFYRVRFAVLTLPLILFLSWAFFLTYNVINIAFGIALLISFLLAPIFLLLLSSQGMRLWGRPSASAPRFARPYQPDGIQPLPVPFFIEYAPADKKYAEAISAGLTKFGHPQAAGPDEAQASFVIISRYKNSTSIDPQKYIVYPVLIQDTNIDDPAIQRIQWIDFRGGIRNLNQMAELLPKPEKLLSALGVAPISGQVLYPRIIQMIDYALVLLAFFSVSAWIPMMAELGKQFLQLDNRAIFFTANFIFSALTLWIIFTARRKLIHREGRLRDLAASFFWIGVIVFAQAFYILALINTVTALAGPVAAGMEDMRGSVSLFMPCSCTLGVLLIGFFSIWNWGDLTRWFPAE